MCVRIIVHSCEFIVHNIAQNNSDNLPSYPPDNHHCSDAVYWRGGDSMFINSLVGVFVPAKSADAWDSQLMTTCLGLCPIIDVIRSF